MVLNIDIDEYFDEDKLRDQLDYSQCGMSEIKVAACLIAKNKEGNIKSFYGSNIELARGIVYHAEQTALINAINEGYTNPVAIVLTANNENYLVPLCYACRSIFSYVNPNCIVIVLDQEMRMKVFTTVHDTMRYHYESHGFIT